MDSYDQNVNTNSVYGTEGTQTGGDFNNTTGMGQTGGFDSTTTTGGGYGQQDRFDNTTSNTGTGMGGGMSTGMGGDVGTGMGGGMGTGMGTGMNEQSFGTNRTDDLAQTQGAGYGGNTGADDFNSGNADQYGSTHGKATMGDKIKGGAEKLAGKVMGNTGMQERGQERKAGDFEQRNDF
ncbi:hypothetical protein C8R45DRAFT_990218 [Mycena sanguinolenta]|nr:hypothetical protein C8R45DRAFT_990218 [Mycena sanguinolenta]